MQEPYSSVSYLKTFNTRTLLTDFCVTIPSSNLTLHLYIYIYILRMIYRILHIFDTILISVGH